MAGAANHQTKAKPTHAKAVTAVDLFDQSALSFTHGNRYDCRPIWSIPPSVVSYDALFFITKGKGWVQYDQQKLDAKPGDLFLTRQGQTVAAGHDPANPITTWSIGFNLSVMGSAVGGMNPLRQLPWPMRLALTQTQQNALLPMFEQFVTQFHGTSTADRLACRGSFFLLLAEVFTLIERLPAARVSLREDRPSLEHSRLTDLMDHIEAHLHQPLPIHTLAKLAHVTPSHLAHLFRKELGMAPSDYVRHRRMTIARSLLRQGDLSIAQIGKQVGFDDPYHFSRVFSRQEGLSPRAYRNASKHLF